MTTREQAREQLVDTLRRHLPTAHVAVLLGDGDMPRVWAWPETRVVFVDLPELRDQYGVAPLALAALQALAAEGRVCRDAAEGLPARDAAPRPPAGRVTDAGGVYRYDGPYWGPLGREQVARYLQARRLTRYWETDREMSDLERWVLQEASWQLSRVAFLSPVPRRRRWQRLLYTLRIKRPAPFRPPVAKTPEREAWERKVTDELIAEIREEEAARRAPGADQASSGGAKS